MVVGHAVHLQVFYRNDPKSIDNGTRMLMSKVITSELNPLMHTRYSFTVFTSFRGTVSLRTQLALDFGKSLLFLAKEAGILDGFPGGERGKGFESHVNPNVVRRLRQAFRFDLTRERHIPLAGRGTMDGTGLHLAFERAMVDHLETANLGEADPLIVSDTEARLCEGERVIAALALEARIARLLGILSQTAKEGLEGQFYPFRHILQDLRMDLLKSRTFLFQ